MNWLKNRIGQAFVVLGGCFVLIGCVLLVLSWHFQERWMVTGVIWGTGLAFCGAIWIHFGYREGNMQIGVVERIKERRKISVAAALSERYSGLNLMDSPEALALPTPIYECGGCGHSYNKSADRMYWVDEQPMLSVGWYCQECVDKLDGKPRHERLNMEIFLVMLDSGLGAE